MRLPIIDVAVNIVHAPDGRVLLAQRTKRQIAAGFWELPGGKVDPGETPAQAAARELEEEIGIAPHRLRRWISYEHAYATKRVRLHFFRVEGYSGTPRGREGQRLAWIDPASPGVAPVLPSNDRVLAAMALPRIIYRPRSAHHGGAGGLLRHLSDILPAGPITLVLDEPEMAPEQYVALARRVGVLAGQYGTPVLLAGPAALAQRAGLPGVLSSAQEMRRLSARPRAGIWAVDCHDEAEVARAEGLGADALLLSPTALATQTSAPAMAWAYFQRLARTSSVPVFAGGGVTPNQLDHAIAAGAAGIVVQRLDTPNDASARRH
jgi:8-oxo-dGTP diphosphatase